MSLQNKLREADLADDFEITLRFEAGADVIHAYDGHFDNALNDTDFASTVARVICQSGFDNEAINDMRGQDFLEDYERDGSGFEYFVSEAINENFYELGFLDTTLEQYDYKRGFLTFEASVTTTVGDIMASPEGLFIGWSATVPTNIGELTING